MTDEELQSTWRDVAIVAAELRRIDQSSLANRLVKSVQSASTSGEIYSDVGNALYEHRALRKQLSPAGVAAWKRVMADVGRAFGRAPFLEWAAGLWKEKPAGLRDWLVIIRISLLAAAFLGMLGCAAAWFLLLERLNHAPRTPSAEQTIPIVRHGGTVFITPLHDALLAWLPAGGAFFGVAIFAASLWVRIASARETK